MHTASRIPSGHPIHTIVAMSEATEHAMLKMVSSASRMSPVAMAMMQTARMSPEYMPVHAWVCSGGGGGGGQVRGHVNESNRDNESGGGGGGGRGSSREERGRKGEGAGREQAEAGRRAKAAVHRHPPQAGESWSVGTKECAKKRQN